MTNPFEKHKVEEETNECFVCDTKVKLSESYVIDIGTSDIQLFFCEEDYSDKWRDKIKNLEHQIVENTMMEIEVNDEDEAI